MRAIIFLNGNIYDYSFYKNLIKDTDYIVCADGGYRHAKNLCIEPNIIIGDLDSITNINPEITIQKYPTKKNATDGEIAIMHAIDMDTIDEIIILGGTGFRLDHTMCNIYLLKHILDANKKGVIIDEHNEICFTDREISISGKTGDLISVISISDVSYGVYTFGLEYELNNYNLKMNSSRGISNVMLSDKCSIKVREGLLMVTKSID